MSKQTDPRTDLKLEVCRFCGVRSSKEYVFCWSCKSNINGGIPPVVNYKIKGRTYGIRELGKIQRENIGKEKDLIQPTQQYDRVHKEFKTNPDFVKHYGDPFKKQNIKVKK